MELPIQPNKVVSPSERAKKVNHAPQEGAFWPHNSSNTVKMADERFQLLPRTPSLTKPGVDGPFKAASLSAGRRTVCCSKFQSMPRTSIQVQGPMHLLGWRGRTSERQTETAMDKFLAHWSD